MNSHSSAETGIHPFDQAMALVGAGPGCWRGHTSRAYWNAVGPYGGTTAAVLLQAMLIDPRREGEPLSLTVNFAAPVAEGEFFIETELVRANRTNQHWALRMRQGEDGHTVALAVAICSLRRETWGDTEAGAPKMSPLDTCAPYVSPRPIEFLKRYDIRYARGTPFRSGDDSLTHAWVADAPSRPLDFASLAALCDCFLPRIFLRREQPVPIGTVSMNIYFHAGADALHAHGAQHLQTCAQAQVFKDGHFDQHGQLWSATGQLLATTHQIVWYKG